MKKQLLIIDDDTRQRELLQEVFADNDYTVTACANGAEALLLLDGGTSFTTVITDLKMPGVSGTDILQACRGLDPELPVIIITGYGSVDSAIAAMKIGAHDYIEKPFDPEELVLVVNKATAHYRLVEKNRRLAATLATLQNDNLIGSSPAMAEVTAMVQRLAPLDVTVLIQGETGTGKELVARLLHQQSNRQQKKFFAVNCGALQENLLESELFGHEKGAFTGADNQRRGIFETASGGTLFLDEINSMSPALQVKLLRVLQEQTFLRVGGNREIRVDIRLISATNADLKEEVVQGRFREDLFYRINAITLKLPALRQRHQDIMELAYYFLNRYGRKYNRRITAIDTAAAARLTSYPWPGNVRELENVISRAVIMAQGEEITPAALPDELNLRGAPAGGELPLMPLAEMERFMIKKALAQTHGNKTQAAALLGIDNSTLWRKMKRWQP